MQATLLGAGIAIILALMAALVGPHFIDWTRYRPQFESEASRVIGSPVHISGPIDLRLLPTPSFSVHEVEIGAPSEPRLLRMHRLSVELGLGPLLRGAWQAVEAHVVGLEVRVALDRKGQVSWPVALPRLNPEQVSIRSLTISDGQAVLADAASGGSVLVHHISFDGELRSLVGPVKGEGALTVDGRQYGFALIASQPDENGVAKLRLKLAPVDRPLSVEADGNLALSDGVPQFDGSLTLSRPAGAVDATGRGTAFVPWQASGQVKLTPGNALVTQAEFQYGPDERALRFSGTASFRFGKSPRFDAVISGQQLDLDSVLDLPEPARHLPVAAVRRVVETFLGPVRPPLPGHVGISVEAVTVAGKPLEDVHGDLTASAKGWELQVFEFRAPGSSRLRTSGRVGVGSDGPIFDGAAAIEAADPNALMAWLEGRPVPPAQEATGLFRASGDVVVGLDHVLVDRLKIELGGRSAEGRLDYAAATARHPPRLNAELKAADIDVDQTLAFIKAASAQAKLDLPPELTLTADVAQARITGVEARNAHLKLALDGNGLVLDRVSVTDLSGARVELAGRLDGVRTAPRGTVHLDIDAQRLEGLIALVSKIAPEVSSAIFPVSARLAPLQARAVLTMDQSGSTTDATATTLDIQGSAGPLRLRFKAEATGNPWQPDSLVGKAQGQIAADNGAELAALTGMERYLAPDNAPATVTLAAQGFIGRDLRVNASFAAGGTSAAASGTVRMTGTDGPRADLEVNASAADLGPAFRPAGAPDSGKLPASISGRLSLNSGSVNLDRVTATIAGTQMKGRLGVTLGSAPKFEGELDANDVVIPKSIAVVVGIPLQTQRDPSHTAPSAPFVPGWFGRWNGRIEFNVAQAALTPQLVARNAHGFVRTADGEIGFENVRADLAGGGVGADITFRQGPDGLVAKARIAVTGINAAAFLPAGDRSAVAGTLTVQAEVQAAGPSSGAMLASLSGIGTVSLDHGRLAHVDPAAFAVAMRAVDNGLPIVPAKILGVVTPALAAGDFAMPHFSAPLTVSSGQLRLINVIAHGDGADVAISGSIDLSSRMVDGQLTLIGPAGGAGLRPDITLALAGPVESPTRTIDVSAFANWLLLRSLDREAGRAEGAANAAPQQGQPLPRPIVPSQPQSVGGASALSPIVALQPEPGISEPSRSLPEVAPPIAVGPLPDGERTPRRPRRTPRPTRISPHDAASRAAPSVSPPPSSILDRLFGSDR